jgi:hypothetical protein
VYGRIKKVFCLLMILSAAQAKDFFERAVVVRPEREKTLYYLAQVMLRLEHWARCSLISNRKCLHPAERPILRRRD